LSVNEEGAKPIPRDVYALWGWDRTERKFVSRKERIAMAVQEQTGRRSRYHGTVYTKTLRQPWYRFKGMFPWDINGPSRRVTQLTMSDAPKPAEKFVSCGKAF
jgi:hypothetical protein